MSNHLEILKNIRLELGRGDPPWAVVSNEEKCGGRRNLEEFLATGECSVAAFQELLRHHAQAPNRLQHVLDFGSGVGRPTCAWSRRPNAVTGVDISAPLQERARDTLLDSPNAKVHLNEKPDLSRFPSAEFDLVISYIGLQHMAWSLAVRYIREFARVCRTGSLLAFQSPARQWHVNWLPALRKAHVDNVPFGWGRKHRRRRRRLSHARGH